MERVGGRDVMSLFIARGIERTVMLRDFVQQMQVIYNAESASTVDFEVKGLAPTVVACQHKLHSVGVTMSNGMVMPQT